MKKIVFSLFALLIIISSCNESGKSDSTKDPVAIISMKDSMARDSLIKSGNIIPKDSTAASKSDYKIDSLVDAIYIKKFEIVSIKYVKTIQDADFNKSYVIKIHNSQRKKTVISILVEVNYPSNDSNATCTQPTQTIVKLTIKPLSEKKLTILAKENECITNPNIYIMKWVNSDGSFYPTTKQKGVFSFVDQMTERTKIKDSLIRKFNQPSPHQQH